MESQVDRKAATVAGAEQEREWELENGGDAAVDAKVEKIYKKLDRRIIPALWVLYFLCAAIRSNVGLALTMNTTSGHSLQQQLHLSDKQISTGLALFYVCYVAFEVPANLIMTKLSPHVWMSRIVVGVGLIGCCHMALASAWSFYLLRLLLGIMIAGMWPGMAYYLTLFYPPSQTGKRVGHYYTAAQVSAAVVGLVSAGFQEMDGDRGYTGYQWMFLLYGVVGLADGIALLWWLPDRPQAPDDPPPTQRRWLGFIPRSPPALSGEDARVHYEDLTRVYHAPAWTVRDLGRVLADWRVWPLTLMYFGVVGVGIGVQNFGTLIIQSTNENLTGVELSLLFAPIWVCDLIAIVIFTPLADRFNKNRVVFFVGPTLLQIVGLLVTTYAPGSWARYGGLLIVGFGLGPTVPTCMTWASEIFQPRHGEVGVAAATAIVSGLGNLGSVLTTYALYTGWASDSQPGPHQYRKSNLVMIGILGMSIVAAGVMAVAVRVVDGDAAVTGGGELDGAARRERERERGTKGPWWGRRRV